MTDYIKYLFETVQISILNMKISANESSMISEIKKLEDICIILEEEDFNYDIGREIVL